MRARLTEIGTSSYPLHNKLRKGFLWSTKQIWVIFFILLNEKWTVKLHKYTKARVASPGIELWCHQKCNRYMQEWHPSRDSSGFCFRMLSFHFHECTFFYHTNYNNNGLMAGWYKYTPLMTAFSHALQQEFTKWYADFTFLTYYIYIVYKNIK